ncbi:MAG: ArnT family glycosyltransferase [Candidatus Lokiarchaeia archaeon]
MKKSWFLLILLLLFIAAMNWLWLTLDTQPPHWDQAHYMQIAAQYSHRLKSLHFKGFLQDLIFFSRLRPPLVMLLTSPVYFFNYRSEDIAVMMNILFMALTFLAIFKICKNYFEPKISTLACFMLSMYPIVFHFTRTYLMELGLMSIVTLSIFFLLKCDNFKSFKYSLFLGLCLGLGMLTKLTYALFMVGPFLYITLRSNIIPFINKGKDESLRSLLEVRRHFLYCVGIASVLTLSWYIPNFKPTVLLFNQTESAAVRHLKPYIWSLKAFLTFYPRAIIKHGISTFFALLFLGSCILFFVSRNFRNRNKVFIYWILYALILLAFALNKSLKYSVPLLPAIAIITAQGIYRIKYTLIRCAVIGLVVLYGLFQFFIYSFDIPLFSHLSSKESAWGRIVSFSFNKWHRPWRVEWRLEDVLDIVKEDMEKENKEEATIVLLSDQWAYNANTLNYLSSKEKLGLYVLNVIHRDNIDSFMAEANYDYAIYRYEKVMYLPLERARIEKAYTYVKNHPKEFMLIDTVRLRDGSDVFIYKHM